MSKRSRNKHAAPVAPVADQVEAQAPEHIVEQPSPEQGAAVLPEPEVIEQPTEPEVIEQPTEPEAPIAPVATDPEAPVGPVVTATDTIHIVIPENAGTPFSFIWAFLAANPTVPRKAQIAAMIAYGLNPNTVKTQVSRFYKVGGDKALWLASEKAKRAAEKAKIDAMVAEIKAKREAEEAAAKAMAEAAAATQDATQAA